MKWKFNLDSGTTYGLNDSGIEIFRDDIYKSLTKEVCQNSLDAINDINQPVIIEFKSFDLDKESFPDIDNLIEIMDLEKKYWHKVQKNDKRAEKFYTHGKSLLKNQIIKFLRISDYNTTGLTGSQEKYGGNWNNLVKSNSVSDKSGSAGGSFGIGKSAVFSVSELRVVFYSTLDIDNIEAFQGVAKFSTFEDKKGYRYAPTGYLVENNDLHLAKCYSLDSDFKRKEIGTDMFVSAFIKNIDWEEMILTSVLNDFLFSLYKRKIHVVVNDKEIKYANIRNSMHKYQDSNNLEENTKDYYNVMENEKTLVFNFTMFEENDVELRLLFDKNLNRRVAIVRQNGMKIFDKDRISTAASFSGICYLKGDEVNKFFKALENPAHNAWRTDGVDDPVKAKKERDRLFGFIVDTVKQIIDQKNSEEIDVEGLNEFIPDFLEENDSEKRKEETISDNIKPIPLSVKKSKTLEKTIKANDPDDTSGENASYGADEDDEGDDVTTKPGSGNGGGGGERGSEEDTKASQEDGDLTIIRGKKLNPLKLKVIRNHQDSCNFIKMKFDSDFDKVVIDISI